MTDESKAESGTKSKKEHKEKASPKTKEDKRKAWRDYYNAKASKYLAWSRGWRSGSKLTFQEFNKKWEAEKKASKKS